MNRDFLGRSGDDGAHLVLALHVGRARAVDFLDFSGCVCFAAALNKNVTLDGLLVSDDHSGLRNGV